MGIEMDPLTLSAARALVSFAVAFVYLLTRRRHLLRVRSRDLPFLAVFGVLGLAMVHFAYFKTISLTGVATAILLEYLAPVIVLVFSVTVLGQRLTPALPAAVFLSGRRAARSWWVRSVPRVSSCRGTGCCGVSRRRSSSRPTP